MKRSSSGPSKIRRPLRKSAQHMRTKSKQSFVLGRLLLTDMQCLVYTSKLYFLLHTRTLLRCILIVRHGQLNKKTDYRHFEKLPRANSGVPKPLNIVGRSDLKYDLFLPERSQK